MNTNSSLNNLFHSINELEQTVINVQEQFRERQDIPEQVHKRLLSYREITNKQKSIWRNLPQLIDADNKEAFVQEVGKINALSSFLLDDLRNAISSLEGQISGQFIVMH
jgi:dsDNA-specific endonuclease/ATPase MutS2